MKKILKFFDKLEDYVRVGLSHYPIVYSAIGSIGIVLLWRGIWMIADELPFMTGPVSIFISMGILLTTGLFVSFFIGDEIILSGLRRDKKIAEKTEREVEEEMKIIQEVRAKLESLERKMDEVYGRK